LSFEFTQEWMDYSHAAQAAAPLGFNSTFANFANTRLGGGWNSGGNVQEEQFAQQCSEFALILAKHNSDFSQCTLFTRKNSREPSKIDPARFASIDTAKPLLLTHLRCLQKLTPDFEKNIPRIYTERYSDLSQVLEATTDAPPINMIALAAPELRPKERGAGYTLTLVRDLFNNAYTAYSLAKKYDQSEGKKSFLHLGRWGAGAFGHNVNMVIAIQYLAATLAEVDHVKFTGLKSDEAQPAILLVDQLIANAYSGKASTERVSVDLILKALIEKVKLDPQWFTRK
jgi:hypothetical protein